MSGKHVIVNVVSHALYVVLDVSRVSRASAANEQFEGRPLALIDLVVDDIQETSLAFDDAEQRDAVLNKINELIDPPVYN